MASQPNFSIQNGTLYASNDASTFSGTGGPAAFDPNTSQFSDIVNSVGLANEPFQDTVYNVDAGDQVTFVIALQNFGTTGYNLKLRDTLPIGFSLPGSDMTVTDGAGNALAYSGNLFSPVSGLTISAPVAAYNDTSGANVVLITFTATATNALSLPGAAITNSAQIVSYAASNGGTNLAPNSSVQLTATTTVQTATFGVTSVANQPPATLAAGQTTSFDITIALPEGSLPDLRIDEILPQIGSSYLQLVSAQIVSVGSHLTTSAPVVMQPNGSFNLGTVVNTSDNLATAADNVVVRLTVSGAGTTAGTGSISTVVSTANPNGGSTRVSQTVTNTLTLGTPDAPPSLAGTSGAQFSTNSSLTLPFQTLVLTDADAAQVQTLTIHLSDRSLGALSGSGLVTNTSGDAVLTGTVDVVQALARTLLFTPAAGASGTETFSLTLNDGAGGIASGQSALTIAPSTHASSLTHFPISTETVLTSTALGSSTYQQVETYNGAISDIGTQFIYDGDTPLAIVALQTGMLISSQAQQTAVQVKGGINVLDMQHGSSFLVSAAGTNQFLLHADQPDVTWNTIANFHGGDSVILYGFDPDTATKWWTASDGATGYKGATLRLDLDGNGTIDSSLTFAGKTTADTDRFSMISGVAGTSHFLAISAPT